MSDYRALECADRAGMSIGCSLFHVEKWRRSKLIKVPGIKCHIKSTIVNAEAIFPKTKLRKGNNVELEVGKVRAVVTSHATPSAIKNQSPTGFFGR